VLGSIQNLFGAGTGGSDRTLLAFNTSNVLEFYSAATTQNAGYTTNAVFRDASAWYHIVCLVDTTNATAADRFKIYINGVQQTLTTTTTVSQNASMYVNSTVAHMIGRESYAAINYLDGYLTEVNFIDGQALTPASFGETNLVTGVWQPKKYAGTYGTNGFYLNFSDNSAATAAAIGKDNSGNGNNWTPNNISVTAGVTYDSMLDVPTQWADGGNGRGNYCTLNPVTPYLVNTTLSQGNLVATKATATSAPKIYGTIGVDSGKWYWEIKLAAQGGVGNYYALIGVSTHSSPSSTDSAQVLYFGTNDATLAGDKNVNGVVSNYGANYVSGDTIGVALDLDALQITFYKNGTSQGVISGLTAATYFPRLGSDGGSNNATFEANFGQRPFAYTPPTGFKALNTLNLPTPTILKGNQYFDATLWTGNGGSQTITNSGGMQPDFAWVKKRSGSENHELTDAVRGANLRLASNTTDAESAGGIAFNSTGLSLTGGYGTDNESGQTYVGWQWKANGTPAVTNTAGSITSTVSAGATQGFSIVTYTGTGANATVGHGLGVAPKMIINKDRINSSVGWDVYHASMNASPATGRLQLNTTAAFTTDSTIWNNTAPTSSVFSIGTGSSANINGNSHVVYCFSEVAGFSRFGSYTGNGSADGPFVFCGFRPRFIMYKRSDSTGNWIMLDTSLNPSNNSSTYLQANLSSSEGTDNVFDILSNGFKLRNGGAASNASGGTYIFMAFAETPFRNSLAR
jgi:hypothetical protein